MVANNNCVKEAIMLVHLPNSISRNARNISCSSVVRSHSSREQAQSWVGSPNFIIGDIESVVHDGCRQEPISVELGYRLADANDGRIVEVARHGGCRQGPGSVEAR